MMKGGKKNMRRGFMCQTPASTAVCMSTGDPRSVIVPRRQYNSRRTMVDHSMLMNTTKYSRLAAEPRSLSLRNINRNTTVATTTSRSTATTLSSVLNQDRERERSQRIVSNTHIVPPPPSLTTSDITFQVVVLRVSLHCQGCAGKVKKHLSKMEGVTSFSIDLETKRVTVTGHVSPVGVLESISKVKKAEFWPCS